MKGTRVTPMCLVMPLLTMLAACTERVTAPSDSGQFSEPRGQTLTASSLAAGTWTSRAPLPTALMMHTAGVVNDPSGQPILYVLGGWGYGLQIEQKRVYAYNATTNKWTERAPMPARRREMNGAATIKGKLYVSGGYNSLGRLTNTLFVYDPKTNKWSTKAPLPNPVANGTTTALGDKLYVLYGDCLDCPNSNISQRLWRYDPATNVWKRMKGAPHHHMPGVGGVINGKWYVTGDGTTQYLDVYDPGTDTWTTKAAMPVRASRVGAAVFANRLYVVGTAPDQRSVWAYNPVTNKWSAETPLPSTRSFAGAARVTRSGRPILQAVGGYDGTLEVATNEQYVR